MLNRNLPPFICMGLSEQALPFFDTFDCLCRNESEHTE